MQYLHISSLAVRETTFLSTWHAWIIASLLDACLANRGGMQYTCCCQETIGVGRPQGSLAVDPTYYQRKGKQWRNPKFGWNYWFGFALLWSAIGNQNLPWEPSKIPITTSTFNDIFHNSDCPTAWLSVYLYDKLFLDFVAGNEFFALFWRTSFENRFNILT